MRLNKRLSLPLGNSGFLSDDLCAEQFCEGGKRIQDSNNVAVTGQAVVF
jgi:hypothetical protein